MVVNGCGFGHMTSGQPGHQLVVEAEITTASHWVVAIQHGLVGHMWAVLHRVMVVLYVRLVTGRKIDVVVRRCVVLSHNHCVPSPEHGRVQCAHYRHTEHDQHRVCEGVRSVWSVECMCGV